MKDSWRIVSQHRCESKMILLIYSWINNLFNYCLLNVYYVLGIFLIAKVPRKYRWIKKSPWPHWTYMVIKYSIKIEKVLQNPGFCVLAAQKPSKRPGWWEVWFIWMSATKRQGEKGRCLSKYPTTLIPTRVLKWKEGVTCWNTTVSFDSSLEVGHQWSDQHHLDCFKYS